MKQSILNVIEKSPSLFLMSIEDLMNIEISSSELNIIRRALLNIHVSERELLSVSTNLVTEKLIEVIKNYDSHFYTETIIFISIGLTMLHSLKYNDFLLSLAVSYSKVTNDRIKPKKVTNLIKEFAPAELFLSFTRDIKLSPSQRSILGFIHNNMLFRVSQSEMSYIASLPDINNLLNTRISKLTKIIPLEDILKIQNEVKNNAN
ncbi:g091 [Yersinia phage phiR1-37]|uniref:hypothetical protein n=1 Tax=Yersinia phage phiR1-37 TaxID=331278 RepID=UPI00022DBD07|nr:hypothetical protein phiR1-37_gp091 [Yersinia phage phiR1-37]CCE26115.1 g091 [Yersinia phage phiR1-37]